MPKATNDRRLIEHYLPIEAISAESRREKSVRKGHISTPPLGGLPRGDLRRVVARPSRRALPAVLP